MKKWVLTGGALAVIGLLIFLYYPFETEKKQQKTSSSQDSVLPIKIAKVTSTDFADFVEAVGSTFAYESAEITSNVTEVVEKINFRDGQMVKRGDVIVVLRYAEESAQLASAKANLKEQEREIERLTGLVKNGAAAVSALDARNTQKQVAEQQILQFEAQIADRIIRAPFDGVLGLRNISVGSLVSPQNVITTIDDLRAMRVDFTVPEIYLGQVSSEMPINVRSQAYPNLAFEGKVVEVDTRVDPSSRSVRVRAEIPNERQLLKPGMLLYVQLALEKGRSPSIPERSVMQTGERKFVYRVHKDYVQRTEITLGRRKPGYVEVISGLAVGDTVATSGLQDLNDGTTIDIDGMFEHPSTPADNTELEAELTSD